MARKKVPSDPALESWADVDSAMKLIGELEGSLTVLEVELNAEIDAAKKRAEKLAQPLHEKIKRLERDIRHFVTENRPEMDGKTKQLTFGRTGFRLSTKLMTPRVADIIARLKQYAMQDCIKVKESIDKEALKKYPTEDILKTGAYLKAEDEFWYEVDREKIQPVE